ncbi:hypothetical protein HpHA66_08790 [Helicobacter pylori]
MGLSLSLIMAVRFGVIFITDNYTIDRREGTYNIEIELVSNANDFRGVFGEV